MALWEMGHLAVILRGCSKVENFAKDGVSIGDGAVRVYGVDSGCAYQPVFIVNALNFTTNKGTPADDRLLEFGVRSIQIQTVDIIAARCVRVIESCAIRECLVVTID